LAAYRDAYSQFQAAESEVVAVSVDPPSRSADLAHSLDLPFPLLCDPEKSVVMAWRALNREERGGIAYPSTWVIDSDLVVRYRRLERKAARVSPEPVLRFLRGELSVDEASALRPVRLGVQGSARWVKDRVSGRRGEG
jgi:peroxiredoxin